MIVRNNVVLSLKSIFIFMLICLLTSWNAPKASPIASNNLLIENIEVLASGEGSGHLDRIMAINI